MSAQIRSIVAEVIETLKSDQDLSQAIGDFFYHIFRKAIDDALVYKIRMVDGKSEPGRQVEKELDVNVIAFLAEYIPNLEGRMLGQQADIGHSRNAADQAAQASMAAFELTQRAVNNLTYYLMGNARKTVDMGKAGAGTIPELKLKDDDTKEG